MVADPSSTLVLFLDHIPYLVLSETQILSRQEIQVGLQQTLSYFYSDVFQVSEDSVTEKKPCTADETLVFSS